MTVRVLLDATQIPPDRGGVGRYVDGLVGAAAHLDVDLRVVCQQRDAPHFATAIVPERVIGAPERITARPARLAWEQTALPPLARRIRADVVHAPHYTMPYATRIPVVVTLHDATFFTHPQAHTALKARFFRTATRLAVRRAARLVAPSHATKDEIVRLLHADPNRIDVAHHGVDHATFRQPTKSQQEKVKAALGIDGGYVAFLGTIEPRKNVPNLIRGWANAVQHRDDPPALVLAGGHGWDTEVDAAIAAVPPHLRVIRPGYLPLDQLPGLLGGADVVAYPSYGEGFGLPVLEAMACGAAVLTTRRLSLPEVGGDAVAYTEPDADAIAVALGALLDDPARTDRLRAGAFERAATFTWEACARTHVEAWKTAASQGHPR